MTLNLWVEIFNIFKWASLLFKNAFQSEEISPCMNIFDLLTCAVPIISNYVFFLWNNSLLGILRVKIFVQMGNSLVGLSFHVCRTKTDKYTIKALCFALVFKVREMLEKSECQQHQQQTVTWKIGLDVLVKRPCSW